MKVKYLTFLLRGNTIDKLKFQLIKCQIFHQLWRLITTLLFYELIQQARDNLTD